MILRGTVFSSVLNMDTPISVVTPGRLGPGQYRVVYLLHGLMGNSATWLDYSLLADYARGGRTVYVMPDGGRSFYADMAAGPRYFSYITEELPQICQSVFNVSAAREDTAVMGCSMGGYGALKAALTRPDLYGFCGAFASPCLFLAEALAEHGEDREKFIELNGPWVYDDLHNAFGRPTKWRAENDILHLAKNLPSKGPRPAVYLACGHDDMFINQNRRFAAEMSLLPINFIFEEWAGRHDFKFFDQALEKAISWLDGFDGSRQAAI